MSAVAIPELSLVVLIGPSGSGKSSFARRHFVPTEVVSSDVCRGLVSDDPNDQGATEAAFELVHFIADKRLERGKLTVIDATNVQQEARRPLVQLARARHVLPVAVVLDLSPRLCHARNQERPDRRFGPHVVRQQSSQLRRSLKRLKQEGFRRVIVLKSPEEVEAVTFERQKLWNDKREERGPFDIIGDVHGCLDELRALLDRLGYQLSSGEEERPAYVHPEGRRVIFVGDLVDRGPDSPGVLELAMAMVARGSALCVAGNHDVKLLKKLRGREVRIAHGLAETLAQLEALGEREAAFREEVEAFLDGLISHYVLDGGELVVAHAGLKEELQGRASGKVRAFALYGETTGEIDAYGLPVRLRWAEGYRGRAMVVYGHTPVPEAEWINRTICIDTGCVFGGALTALRYPERELVSVPAARVYYEPVRPVVAESAEEPRPAHLLDIEDVAGKRILRPRIDQSVTVREENAAAALEVMSRFALDPRWLIYLPPTMSPAKASRRAGLLEHPEEAFAYYRDQGVPRVVCEEKHMGSRAVVIACRDAEAAARRFGVEDGKQGVIYTRTGRAFFGEDATEAQLIRKISESAEDSGLYERLGSDWLCLDVELLPWSAKAQELLRAQYAPVAAASRLGLGSAVASLEQLTARDPSAQPLLDRFRARLGHAERYAAAYAHYCWPVESVDDLKVAPFHLLASEGKVHTDRDHLWHMRTLNALAEAAPGTFRPTRFLEVEVTDEGSVAAGVAWWTESVEAGGEGMVIKPLEWLPSGKEGPVQPALKCRGPEYLRIIYGPEYRAKEHIERLRSRHLGAKRKLARKEFALGIEALHRFVEGAPLYQVHECVFGVLALESEPVDPRL